jgi:hypothetical protein
MTDTKPNSEESTSANVDSGADSKDSLDPPARRRITSGGCLFKIFLLLGFFVAGIFLVQRWLIPEVDADKTRPVVISQGDPENSSDKPATGEDQLNLPEGAVSATVNQAMFDQAEHPFDPLLELAELSLQEIDENIKDYTATMVSQVRIGNELKDEKYLALKIRHARVEGKGKKIPFSVYTLFLKPQANVGQEAIWIEGQNDGNLIAHANGLMNIKRFYLSPEGPIAMDGNRYPIQLIGMRNLIVKMVDMAKDERQFGECTVTLKRNVEVNGRICSMFEAVHPVKRDHFDFHIARIYIDDNHNIPVAYEGLLWPEKEGEEPPLLERYFYTDIKFNVGLTDKDFDPSNEEYNYPKW